MLDLIQSMTSSKGSSASVQETKSEEPFDLKFSEQLLSLRRIETSIRLDPSSLRRCGPLVYGIAKFFQKLLAENPEYQGPFFYCRINDSESIGLLCLSTDGKTFNKKAFQNIFNMDERNFYSEDK